LIDIILKLFITTCLVETLVFQENNHCHKVRWTRV
jgi:hypothetical protein